MNSAATVRRHCALTAAIALAALASGLLACRNDSPSVARSDATAVAARARRDGPISSGLATSRRSTVGYLNRANAPALDGANAEDKAATPSSEAASPTDIRPGTMLIRTATIALRVDSLERAIARARSLAAQLGGTVGDVEVNTGEQTQRSASLELRIPTARFDDALSGVSPIGTVEHSTSGAEDVGEEYVDMAARIANGRRLEERLITLLATRPGKLSDVLLLERELARVRGEIEHAEGRRRYLGRRAATSTITLAMHEPLPIIARDPGDHPFRDALGMMWHNFTGLVAFSVASLGYIVPLGLALLLAYRTRRTWRAWQTPAADPRA